MILLSIVLKCRKFVKALDEKDLNYIVIFCSIVFFLRYIGFLLDVVFLCKYFFFGWMDYASRQN